MLDNNGTDAAFVSTTRLSAIETLGERLYGDFTAEQAMEHGHLGGWNVRKVPAFAYVEGKKIAKDGMFEVVRDNPFKPGQIDVLSKYSVGKNFNVIQNEGHAEFLNTLVDESGANFELAGATDGGRKVFLSMRLPGGIQIGGVDPLGVSLLAINYHDGSGSFTLAPTIVRYACSNVLNSAVKGNSGLVRIRHTSGAQKNMVQQAREALDLSFKYVDSFEQEAEQMIQTAMTQMKFESILAKEFFPGEDASNAAFTRSTNKVEEMVSLFADSKTHAGVRDTVWAGYNAMTEWYDHFSPTRGEDRDASRAQRAILDPEFKTKALNLMMSFV